MSADRLDQVIRAIAEESAAAFDVPVGAVLSRRQTRRVIEARQMAAMLCWRLTSASQSRIARALGRSRRCVSDGIAIGEERVADSERLARIAGEVTDRVMPLLAEAEEAGRLVDRTLESLRCGLAAAAERDPVRLAAGLRRLLQDLEKEPPR